MTLVVALALAALFKAPAALADEANLTTMFQQEEVHLASMSENRKRALLGADAKKAPAAETVTKGQKPALGWASGWPWSKKAKQKPIEIAFTRSWIDALPAATGGAEWQCLSEALYFEARGETVKGQFAVAEVIMNRAKSSKFPDTVCGVIRQGAGGRKHQCQFSYKCDGYAEVFSEKQAYERMKKVARVALDGEVAPLTDGATFYHTKVVRPRWSRKFHKTATIGVHYFYRPEVRTASN